ncbi:MAG TPA: glycerate kinase, partial [Candidatus Angelobacter sp.]|nr:glycerate kinase [Candidatus Angelobacter sp.]
LPMADGGEGTLDSLVTITNGEIVNVPNVKGPNGQLVQGKYGITGNGRVAIIELAVASGLHLTPPTERRAGLASTYGTGQLIRHALDRGVREFIIGLGGSATTDGGVGLLKALGYKFKDNQGECLPDGGQYLSRLHRVDEAMADKRLRDSRFSIASDVTNPLIGPNGAAHIFGPQKGADLEEVEWLDQALTHYADCIEATLGLSFHNYKGAGAAGGTATGLMAFLKAELQSGVEVVKDAVGFDQLLEDGQVELIITGEGQLDGQTGFGKVISGICMSAVSFGIPVIALVGAIKGDVHKLYEEGLTAAFSITNGPITLEESMAKTSELLYEKAEQVLRVWALKK